MKEWQNQAKVSTNESDCCFFGFVADYKFLIEISFLHALFYSYSYALTCMYVFTLCSEVRSDRNIHVFVHVPIDYSESLKRNIEKMYDSVSYQLAQNFSINQHSQKINGKCV